MLFGYAAARPAREHNIFNWQDTKYVVAFGDSYTYVQGTHGLQNFSFIGDFQDLSFTPEELLTDRIVQNLVRLPEWALIDHTTGMTDIGRRQQQQKADQTGLSS